MACASEHVQARPDPQYNGDLPNSQAGRATCHFLLKPSTVTPQWCCWCTWFFTFFTISTRLWDPIFPQLLSTHSQTVISHGPALPDGRHVAEATSGDHPDGTNTRSPGWCWSWSWSPWSPWSSLGRCHGGPCDEFNGLHSPKMPKTQVQ